MGWRLFIERVVILDQYTEKIQRKHRVEENEVREVFRHRRTKFRKPEKGRLSGEDLFGAYGRTQAGRYLSIFFIYKPNHYALS